MKLLIFRILFLQQILASPSLPKAKYSKCIVEDGGNVEVSGIFETTFRDCPYRGAGHHSVTLGH